MQSLLAITLLATAACTGGDAAPDANDADADLRPSEWQVDTTAAGIPCEDEPSVPTDLHILPRRLNTAEPVVPEFMFTCTPLELDELEPNYWLLYCEAMSFRAPVGGGDGRVLYTVQTSSGTCVVDYAATFEEM